MDFLKDRRVVAFGGAGLALMAGLVIAWALLSRSHAPTEPPPASQGGLVVVSGRDDDVKLDPKRPLRCFVGGQFVGELPLAVCAQRNGVATGALDVGLDQAGALAASNEVNADITPLPPQASSPQPMTAETAPDQEDQAAAPSSQASGAGQSGVCWRYGAGGWRKLPTPASLTGCVQTLFAGRCPSGDDAFYGRWGDQTLRLMSGRVEVSDDNRDFRGLIDPWPGCAGASQ